MINNLAKCTESVPEKHFFIKDGDNQKPAFITAKNGEFEVINKTDSAIKFLKIDSCIYNSGDTSRCDCAVYNNDTFCFIELKCIRPSKFTKNRKKAETQLKATIIDLQNEDLLQNKKLEAYVCLNCFTEIDAGYEPITQQPENKDLRTYFELELDTIIDYTTKKEFN